MKRHSDSVEKDGNGAGDVDPKRDGSQSQALATDNEKQAGAEVTTEVDVKQDHSPYYNTWGQQDPQSVVEQYQECEFEPKPTWAQKIMAPIKYFSMTESADPYIVLKIGGKKFKTPIVFNSEQHLRFHDHVFTATREEAGKKLNTERGLRWKLMDDDIGANRCLGRTETDLTEELPANQENFRVQQFTDSNGRFAGAIVFSVTMTESDVTVKILRLEHLQEGMPVNDEENSSKMLWTTVAFFAYILVCAAVMTLVEGWNYGNGIYFTIVTLFSVGYGDMYPETTVGLWINTVFIFVNLFLIGTVLSFAANYLMASSMKSGSKRQKVSVTWENTKKIVVLTILLGGFITLNTFIMMGEESWNFIQALHFSFVTLSTVGYGDLGPSKAVTKIWICVYILVMVTMVGKLLNMILDTAMAIGRKKRLRNAIDDNFKLIEILDQDGDGQISKFEFLSRMLVFTRLVNRDELDALLGGFGSVDSDGDGTVNIREIQKKYQVMGSTFSLDVSPFSDSDEESESTGNHAETILSI